MRAHWAVRSGAGAQLILLLFPAYTQMAAAVYRLLRETIGNGNSAGRALKARVICYKQVMMVSVRECRNLLSQ